MTNEIALVPTELPDVSGQLVAIQGTWGIAAAAGPDRAAGEAAAFRTLEFFISCTPNPHTRGVYAQAVRDFCAFGAALGADLRALSSPTVAAWMQTLLAQGKSAATVDARLSGLLQWLGWLARHGAITGNAADHVKGIRRSVREGKTPIMERDEAKRLLESITGADFVSLRDKAILGVTLFGAVRVTAVCKLRLRNFEEARRLARAPREGRQGAAHPLSPPRARLSSLLRRGQRAGCERRAAVPGRAPPCRQALRRGDEPPGRARHRQATLPGRGAAELHPRVRRSRSKTVRGTSAPVRRETRRGCSTACRYKKVAMTVERARKLIPK